MRLISNSGEGRVVDLIRADSEAAPRLDVVTSALSLFAYAELRTYLTNVRGCRLVLPADHAALAITGSRHDRAARNRLRNRWLAAQLRNWLANQTDIRHVGGPVPQGAIVLRDDKNQPLLSLFGSLGLSTDGLGLTPGNPLAIIQASETPDEAAMLAQWFEDQWASLPDSPAAKAELIARLEEIARHRDPHAVYALILHHLFASRGDELDEEQIVKSATGIRNTVVWRKLYKFQRDGVVGAIDKLIEKPLNG